MIDSAYRDLNTSTSDPSSSFRSISQPLLPAVSALLPPQYGTHCLLASALVLHHILSVAFVKPTVSTRPSVPPSGSHKCLRFGFFADITHFKGFYLFTYLLISCTHCVGGPQGLELLPHRNILALGLTQPRSCCPIVRIIANANFMHFCVLECVSFRKNTKQQSRAIAGRTARCRRKFRCVSNYRTASCGFRATARLSCWSLSACCNVISTSN